MSDTTRTHQSALNRRQLLQLSTAAGVGAAMPDAPAGAAQRGQARTRAAASATCSTPRTAVATTQYGKVRGYVEDDVLTFKGVPYGATTAGEHRWLPAKPPTPWDGELPTLIYGANCPQRLHDWPQEQSFLYQWTDGWQSEDMLKLNVWTTSLTGSRPVMVYFHGGGFAFGSAYELASQDGAQQARHHASEQPWLGGPGRRRMTHGSQTSATMATCGGRSWGCWSAWPSRAHGWPAVDGCSSAPLSDRRSAVKRPWR